MQNQKHRCLEGFEDKMVPFSTRVRDKSCSQPGGTPGSETVCVRLVTKTSHSFQSFDESIHLIMENHQTIGIRKMVRIVCDLLPMISCNPNRNHKDVSLLS